MVCITVTFHLNNIKQNVQVQVNEKSPKEVKEEENRDNAFGHGCLEGGTALKDKQGLEKLKGANPSFPPECAIGTKSLSHYRVWTARDINR